MCTAVIRQLRYEAAKWRIITHNIGTASHF